MPQFYNYYGILIEDLGQKIGAFMEAIQIDSQNTIAIDNLAEQYLIHGKFEESVKLYLKSMEINPGNTRAYMGVIVICLIYGIDYIRNLNVNYINNLKKYPYYRAQTEFFIDKCRSYINFVQEFEANDLSMLISSALEFVEYNQVITKKLENFQLPNTIKQLKKSETGEDFLHILYNLQLTTLPDIVGNEQNNQMLTKFYQNNIQNGILKLSEEDNILMDKYFNGISQNLEELYNIFAQKVQNENEILVQGIKSSCNISSFADFKDEATVEQTQHYSLVYYMNQHLQNINLFLILGNLCGVQDAQKIFKKMAFNISSTNCDILFKNCSRFFNVYQIQINICLNYYNYLCNIYQADKNEINNDIKQALIMYSNAKIQVQNMTDWVLCQLQDDLNEIDIYDFSDYYYLQGLHAQKQQDHRLVQKKLFGSLLMNPQQMKNREAYYSHQISVERKMVLTDASRYLNVNQYEKRLLNSINSEQLTLNQKISLLQKGCIYINKPNIWYLLVHFSLEDTNKYDKKFFIKMFLLLKQNVINKLNKDLNKVDRILKRGVKLLHEIFWKIKQLYPEEKKTLLEIKACIDENSQILPEGQDFNQKVEIYFKSGEQQINQLRQIIQQKPDFDTLKLLFEICRNLFVTQKGKNLIELLQEMRNLIINMEESLTTHKSKMKLYNMIQYIDGFIYIAAIQEQYDENREYDQVDILEIVAEASQNIVGYKEQSTNTIFLHLLYCYQNNLKEEMAQYLQILQYFPVIHNVKDDFLHNYFEVLQRYGKLIDKDETRIYDAIEDFLQFVELIQEQFYEQFNSSIKSLYYYMQGIAKLKMAEYEPETDRKSLTKNFKLSILYRPDLGSQIIKDFVQ
ncbi:hypothetical protein PPERSA_07547 [Pseudocohnilembus persalinus]|uniref:Uncharacterized protein n=1 Tax=Pseudocohnilembus persalinus TaxID=266149 RepID=A0A0V0R0W2_PSEPJ|nr:hypothetical protein PPERSA_07547 [Pseudocohnilembus persalinus]|eukprot:KRX07797.1 hypothetical protein PPERSA_07547 [Pseudocohnilembus persalinus]